MMSTGEGAESVRVAVVAVDEVLVVVCAQLNERQTGLRLTLDVTGDVVVLGVGCEAGDVIGTEELRMRRKTGSDCEHDCCGEWEHAHWLGLVANVSANETEKVGGEEVVTDEEYDAVGDVTDTNEDVEEGERGKLGGVGDYVGCADSGILLETPAVTEQGQHLKMFHTTPFPLVFDQLLGIHLKYNFF